MEHRFSEEELRGARLEAETYRQIAALAIEIANGFEALTADTPQDVAGAIARKTIELSIIMSDVVIRNGQAMEYAMAVRSMESMDDIGKFLNGGA